MQHRWLASPGTSVADSADRLSFAAGPRTDWFRDVRSGDATADAPVAVVAEGTPLTVSCHVSATLRSTFDAAGILVHHDDEHWVKYALERSPSGRPTLVTVRTDRWSDDVNHRELADASCTMRVTLDDRSIALHLGDGPDGPWQLLRYAAAAHDVAPTVGLLVQSPTGDGATGVFSDVRIAHTAVTDLRDGS